MVTSMHLWLCLWVCVCVVSPSPVKVVAEDDMSVLMYGVLQFGESLHHAYQNTDAKLARIKRAITHTERLVQQLDRDTEKTMSSERHIKHTLRVIQAETAVLHTHTQNNKRLIYMLESQDAELKHKLTAMEATVRTFTPDRIRALQVITHKRNTHLHDLMSWTEKQKHQLERQNQQVAELHKRMNRSV